MELVFFEDERGSFLCLRGFRDIRSLTQSGSLHEQSANKVRGDELGSRRATPGLAADLCALSAFILLVFIKNSIQEKWQTMNSFKFGRVRKFHNAAIRNNTKKGFHPFIQTLALLIFFLYEKLVFEGVKSLQLLTIFSLVWKFFIFSIKKVELF